MVALVVSLINCPPNVIQPRDICGKSFQLLREIISWQNLISNIVTAPKYNWHSRRITELINPRKSRDRSHQLDKIFRLIRIDKLGDAPNRPRNHRFDRDFKNFVVNVSIDFASFIRRLWVPIILGARSHQLYSFTFLLSYEISRLPIENSTDRFSDKKRILQ